LPKTNKVILSGKTGRLIERALARKKNKHGVMVISHDDPVIWCRWTRLHLTMGLKRYIFTALDVSTRFAFAYAYTSNSSAMEMNFLAKFIQVAPLPPGESRPITGANLPNTLTVLVRSRD